MDTLAYAKKLTAAGVPEHQAEIQAEALAEALRDQTLTRGDLLEVRADLLQALKDSDENTVRRIDRVKSELPGALNKNIQEIRKEIREAEKNVLNKLFLRLTGVIVVATVILGVLIGIFY